MNTEFIAHYIGPDKRGQTVQEHLGEASELASIFASKIGLPSLGKLEGLLHDFGKYSKDFQVYIRSAEGKLEPDAESVNAKELKGKIDHSTAGAQIVWEGLKDGDSISRLFAQLVALCIASHHGGLIDCLSPDGEDKFSLRMAKNGEATHVNEARRVADRKVLDEVTNLVHSPQCVEELKRQLERLFLGEESTVVREFYVGLLVRFVFSALIDADRLSSAGRSGMPALWWNVLIDRLERYMSTLKQENWVDEVRSEVSAACKEFASREKGLYQLTVPTGGAKTLSSLRFGLHHAARHQMDRLIYVIPYISIIDQNAKVARRALEEGPDGEREAIVLEHHSNLTPEKENWQNSLLAENWDATVIFTTSVQFLGTLFGGGTRGVRRMHQLANAVIIFDEVQTLPIKTVHLFNNAINFLVKQCGSTVVFCTATQPLLHAVEPKKGAAKLSDKPEMAPSTDKLRMLRQRVQVLDKRKVGGWTESETAQYVCDEAKQAGSALAIVNTKSAAAALYNLCKQNMDNVFHLSANMCPAHRLRIIDEIKNWPQERGPMVCVSTQVIEAGVDIDFGSVLRYLAGLDSIAQAAGRCNRNGRRPSGNVIIVNPGQESLDKLPDINIGKKVAERVLDEYLRSPDVFDNYLLSPKAMQRYYEYYFFNRAHEMAYRVSSKEVGRDDDLLSMLSTNPLSVVAYKRPNKSAPPLVLRQSFRSAGGAFEVIDAPTEGIIVPYGEDGRRIIAELCTTDDLDKTKKLLREAQRFSVNLFPNMMKKLADMRCIYETQEGSGIFYLDERYYSKDVGVVLDGKEDMGFLNG